MKTYWDLSPKERANLTRDDVEAYVGAELMSRGVLRPAPLELVPEPALPEPEVTLFVIGREHGRNSFGFVTEEAARAAAKTAMTVESHYEHGQFSYYAQDFGDEPEIRSARHHSKAQVELCHSLFMQANAAKAANEKRKREYQEQTKATTDALEELWSDWNAMRDVAAKMARVLTTYEEYRTLSGGDDSIARKFLAKAFTESVLEEASEWHGFRLTWEANGRDAEEAPIATEAPQEAAAF